MATKKTPVRRTDRETPKEVLDYIEASLYDAELEAEETHDSAIAKEAARDINFLESLQKGVEKYGSLTTKQEAAVRRMMRRNKDAALPPLKERIEFIGEVVSVRAKEVPALGPHMGERVILFNFTMFNSGGVEINFSIREGSQLYNQIDLDCEYDAVRNIYKVTEYPDGLRIKGTVKRTRPGRVWLTRVARPKT